jgi:hypothetical protein
MAFQFLRLGTRRHRLLGLGLLLASSAVIAFLLLRGHRSPTPFILSLSRAEAWEGVGPEQRIGILLLLKDHLELSQDRPVVEEANLADPVTMVATRIELAGKRLGNELILELRTQGPGPREGHWVSLKGSPAACFQAALAHLRTPYRPKLAILPSEPSGFWDLAEATGWRIDQDPGKPLRMAKQLVEREPRCAGAWASYAALTYWQLGREAGKADTESFHHCEALFLRTFELVPHYPRAVDDYIGFKTDIGNAREAMETGFAALARYPSVAHLHGALAYPARVSGLLEGASRTLRARDALAGPHSSERNQVENTFLYRGDWELFERTLGPGSEAINEPAKDFYRGYVNLIRGQVDRARPFFARAQRVEGSWVQFEALARVFELGLSHDREAALKALRRLKADRALLRVPDGEFTFKLAEAFAFLGEPEEATQTALRAFAQGFACTRWYLESPLLASVPHQARWNSLTQHLKERQELMEKAFPPRRFGPR